MDIPWAYIMYEEVSPIAANKKYEIDGYRDYCGPCNCTHDSYKIVTRETDYKENYLNQITVRSNTITNGRRNYLGCVCTKIVVGAIFGAVMQVIIQQSTGPFLYALNCLK